VRPSKLAEEDTQEAIVEGIALAELVFYIDETMSAANTSAT
jgi:hypothetical protein